MKAPGPPPGPPPAQPVNATRAPRPLQMHEGVLTTPVSMPAKPVMIDEAPLTAAELGLGSGVPNGVAGGDRNGLPGGIASAVAAQVPVFRPAPPAPPPQGAKAPAAANPDPVRVSRGVQEGLILHKVIPEYPPLARTARISGVVQLMGRIGTDGHIRELQLLSGHPLLVNSALGAVRQWVYRPTLLNGEPVEVIAPITVTFRLN